MFSYKLTTVLVSPSPNIDSINEILYFNKIDGTLIQSITQIQGTGVYGWAYTKTIHVTQSFLFWIILLIASSSSGVIALVVYRKKRGTFKDIDEEL